MLAPAFVKGFGRGSSEARPKSRGESPKTSVTRGLNYPVTSMPTPTEVSQKPEAPIPLKVTIPKTRFDDLFASKSPVSAGKVISDDTFKNDKDLLALSRKFKRETMISQSPTKNTSQPRKPPPGLPPHPRSRIHSQSQVPPKHLPQLPNFSISAPTPQEETTLDGLPYASQSHSPIRDRIPSDIKAQLSSELAAVHNPQISAEQQSSVYAGVLALLSSAIEDSSREKRISAVVDIRQSLTESAAFEDNNVEDKRGSKINRTSAITMSVYSTLSNIPYDPKEDMASNKEASLKRSTSIMVSEANSQTGRWLSKKLSSIEDPKNLIDYSQFLVPRHQKTLSGATDEILAQLEEEFLTQRKRKSTETISSISTISTDNEDTWTPSDEVSRAATVVKTGPAVRDMIISIAERSVDGATERSSALWSRESVYTVSVGDGLWAPTPRTSARPTSDRVHKEIAMKQRDSVRYTREMKAGGEYFANLMFEAKQGGVIEERATARIWQKPLVERIGTDTKPLLWSRPISVAEKVSQRKYLWTARNVKISPSEPLGLWIRNPHMLKLRRKHVDIRQNTPQVRSNTSMTRSRESRESLNISLEGRTGLWKRPIATVRPSGHLRQPPRAAKEDIGHSFGSTVFARRSNASDSAVLVGPIQGQLWTPPPHPRPIISTYGLWSRDLAAPSAVKRAHQQWTTEMSSRSEIPRRVQSEIPTPTLFTYRTGLWKREARKSSSKTETGLWKSKSLPKIAFHDTLLPVLPFSTNDLFESALNTDVAPNSAKTNEVSPPLVNLISAYS